MKPFRDDAASSQRTGRRDFVADCASGLRGLVWEPGLAGTAAVALVLTVITWPVMDLVPQAGLDPSWEAGLAMALTQHLAWGPRIDFTYGPLGFFVVPTLYYEATSLLSICYLLVTRWLFLALLLRASYTKFTPYLALAATLVVGATAIALLDAANLLMGIELLLAIEAFRSEEPRNRTVAVLTLGTLAGAGLLVKFSVGLLGVGLAAVVVGASATRWRRDLAAAGGAFAVSLLVAWVATGNSLSNLFQYLHMSEAIAAGYSGAMSLEVGRIDEWYYAAIVLGCLAACAYSVLRATGRREQLCVTLAFLGYSWVALKEGYVRHDGHDLQFFGLILVAFVALPWPKLRMPTARVAGALALATTFTWTAAGSVPSNLLDFSYDTHQLASSLATVLQPTRRAATIAQARTALRSGYQIPASFLAQMRGQTVAIETYENTVAWAFQGFKWDPEPVLQQYSAYEASLDHLDANFLRSRHAPTRILAMPAVPFAGINENPYFEAPTADVELLCRYAQLGATPTWQLLARVPNRCGPLKPLETVHAKFGQTLAVPQAPPGDAVVATFHGVGSSLLYRVENLVLKARAIQMTVPGTSYRFIAATASDMHIMEVPSTLGYSSQYAPAAIGSFTLYERNLLTDGGRYRVTFYAMSLKSATPPAS